MSVIQKHAIVSWKEGIVMNPFIELRHSVRQYLSKPIEAYKREVLDQLVTKLNKDSGLHMQICYDEPDCFHSALAHYGKFTNVNNYIAIVGPKGKDAEEKAGYYGEQLVLKAQEIGLNTCWVALTHGKTKAEIKKSERLIIVIALGYGAVKGAVHRSKSIQDISDYSPSMPQWYRNGLDAALLAPTAVNQQKFFFSFNNGSPSVRIKGIGACTHIDLGIVRYHFELESGHPAA